MASSREMGKKRGEERRERERRRKEVNRGEGQSEERRETEERRAPGVSSLLDAELVWQMELSVWLSA